MNFLIGVIANATAKETAKTIFKEALITGAGFIAKKIVDEVIKNAKNNSKNKKENDKEENSKSDNSCNCSKCGNIIFL